LHLKEVFEKENGKIIPIPGGGQCFEGSRSLAPYGPRPRWLIEDEFPDFLREKNGRSKAALSAVGMSQQER
jgi:hypothetical protein